MHVITVTVMNKPQMHCANLGSAAYVIFCLSDRECFPGKQNEHLFNSCLVNSLLPHICSLAAPEKSVGQLSLSLWGMGDLHGTSTSMFCSEVSGVVTMEWKTDDRD